MKIVKIFILITFLSLFSCSQEIEKNYKKISEIPEASWICYMEKSDTFFVANDEGKIYEIDKNWKILKEKNIWNYDFEWIVCNNEKEEIYVLIENSWNLLKVDSEKLDMLGDYILDLSKKERKKYFNEKSWAEWLAFDGKNFYISTQNKKNNLLKFSTSNKKNNKLNLEKVYDVKYDDLSWMTFYNKELYIISDKNDLYLIYDLENKENKISKELDKWDWEGIVFDNKWKLFLADDSGKIVEYYK